MDKLRETLFNIYQKVMTSNFFLLKSDLNIFYLIQKK